MKRGQRAISKYQVGREGEREKRETHIGDQCDQTAVRRSIVAYRCRVNQDNSEQKMGITQESKGKGRDQTSVRISVVPRAWAGRRLEEGEALSVVTHTSECRLRAGTPNKGLGDRVKANSPFILTSSRDRQLTCLHDKGAVLALMPKAVERLPGLSQTPAERTRNRTHFTSSLRLLPPQTIFWLPDRPLSTRRVEPAKSSPVATHSLSE